MFTIGESRTISHTNDTEMQAQQVAANPRRGRFFIETPLSHTQKIITYFNFLYLKAIIFIHAANVRNGLFKT